MKSARLSRFGTPAEVIELVETEDPGRPGDGEVLIDVLACPINPADVLMLEGGYGASPPPLPLTPGAEGLGRIAQAGAGVKHVKAGDLVLVPGPGTWRERIKAPAKAVLALHSKADLHQLAMLRVNPATAYLLLHDYVPAKAGSWVIQNAANSGVGHCLIRLARQAGVKTINVVRREALVAPLKAYGADVVLVDGPDLDQRARAAHNVVRAPRYKSRDQYVFEHRALRKQAVILKDESDLGVAKPGQLPRVELVRVAAAKRDRARCRRLERAKNVEQRALAAARWPHDRSRPAGRE